MLLILYWFRTKIDENLVEYESTLADFSEFFFKIILKVVVVYDQFLEILVIFQAVWRI